MHFTWPLTNQKGAYEQMAKTITFVFEKTSYTLEYTRETVSALEQNGLTLDDVRNIDQKPINTVMMLFTGAFMDIIVRLRLSPA